MEDGVDRLMYERDLCKISATHQRSKRHWSWHTMNQVHRWPSMFIEVALVVLWQSEGPSSYRQHVSHSALANDLEFNSTFFRIKKSNFYYIMMTSSMETFSALLAHLCGEWWIPAQRPVTRSFGAFFDLRLNKRLSKQSWGWWFETLSRPLWRHCNVLRGRDIVILWLDLTQPRALRRVSTKLWHPD